MRGTVCLIEDDPLIRLSTALLLQQSGFRVVDFDSVDVALAQLSHDADEIIMIFTCEHTQGVFSGRNLAHIAATKWPWITVVVTLGAEAAQDELPARTIALRKGWGDEDVLTCAAQAEQAYQTAFAERI